MLYSPVHKAITSILCVAFAAGILCQQQLRIDSQQLLIVLAISQFVLIVLQFTPTSKYTISNHFHLAFIIITCFTLGAYRLQITHTPPSFDSIKTLEYVATVQKVADEKAHSYKVELIIDSAFANGELHKSKIRMLAYLEKTTEAAQLLPGQVIYFQAQLQQAQGPSNPEGFNYNKYLSFKNIYATCYIPQKSWALSQHQNHSIFTRASQIQHIVVTRLAALPFGAEELGVLSALTVGFKQLIDDNQRQAYAASGGTHVLAVSGLHVGILFVFLSRIFFLFGKKKCVVWIKTIVIILSLWAFAFISGLSPSVCRATLMFSCISIGLAQQRKSNIFNMVFISAFILLIINPLNLYALGFQLSYAAVLGILTFQPMFESVFHEKWHIYKPLAELLSVSVAAQLGTVPIAIHTFNTFPLYFLLTNIWIIPLVTVILNTAIILIIMCLLNIPCTLLAKGLNILLSVMNGGVDYISQLPYAQLQNLYLSNIQAILSYLFLFVLGLAILYHSKQMLSYSLLCMLLLCSSFLQHSYQQKDKQCFFAFYHRDCFNLCIQQGNSAILSTKESIELPDYLIHHHLKGSALDTIKINNLQKKGNVERIEDFIIAGNQIMGLYSKHLEKHTKALSISTMIIENEEPKNIYKLHEVLAFKELIFYKKPEKFYYYRNFCTKHNIKLHIIQKDGAYISELESVDASSLAKAN